MTSPLNEEAVPNNLQSKLQKWNPSCCLISMHLAVLFLTLALCLTCTTTRAQESEGGSAWPRELQTSEGAVVIYQPQLESLEGDVLKGRAAFSLRAKKEDEPEFGALWFNSKVAIDRDERIANVSNTKIPRATLSESTDAEKKELARAIEEKVSAGEMSLSLDRLIAALNATDQERKEAAELRTDPPNIIISKIPAVLVYIDGDPTMAPIQGTKFLQVENSPFPIVLDPKTKAFYLNGGDIWYKATNVLGPWKNVAAVPKDISALLELSEEEKKQLKGGLKDERIPEIVVATEPTELIFIDGETKFTPLVGTELLYVQNSETPLFFDTETEDYYVLLSGRWYASSGLVNTQAWEFVPPDELPEAFADIPPDSDLAEVRANVAGTDEAEEAVLDASIPQTSAINRKEAKLEITYDGKPEFEPVNNTTIKRAVNTQFTVMKIGGGYYAVDQGIWFVSESPKGPWVVADEVPEEVEEIPPSSPVYNVKYVKVYDSTPEYVYYGYTPGYVGSYILYRTVVYGTGYWYRCGWRRSYYACPLTWGFGAIYRPWAGWTFGLSYTRFHFHIGFRGGYRWHRDHHGHYRYRNGWWGPGGYHSRRYVDHRRRHHNAAYARHRRNIYNRPDNRKRNQFKDRRPAQRPGTRSRRIAPITSLPIAKATCIDATRTVGRSVTAKSG